MALTLLPVHSKENVEDKSSIKKKQLLTSAPSPKHDKHQTPLPSSPPAIYSLMIGGAV